MISKPPTRATAVIEASDLRLGGEVDLTLSVDAPNHTPIPLQVKYFVPKEFSVIQSDMGSATEERAGYQAFEWHGEQHDRLVWRIRLRIGAVGFFRLFGESKVAGASKAQEAALQEEIADNIPDLRGVEGAERRRAFIQSKQGLKILDQSLEFTPAAYYVEVSRTSGRVETWDFGSLWSRFKHRIGVTQKHVAE